jgi:hypothetical protein
MELNTDNLSGKELLEHDIIHASKKEHMLLIKFTRCLLRLFKGFELSLINKFKNRKYWLILGLRLVRHIFASNKVHLERVQFVPQEFIQERLVNMNSDVEIQKL